MGFWGDVINDFLDGDGTFGQKLRKDNPALTNLYRTVYFDFGLTPLRNLKEGSEVPITVQSGFGNQIFGFEIHGNIHTPGNFMTSSWGSVFHTIARDIPLDKGRVWAYDIRRLDESILIGSAVYPGDEAYRKSEEYLKILRLVSGATTPSLSRVPAIELEFGRFWMQFGLPDRISVSLDSVYPLSDNHLKNVINLILHNYNRNDALPVVADYTWDPTEGTLELVMKDKPEPTVTPPAAAPEPETKHPEDGFPYGFYRDLGLIDDEDMVTVPSMLGPVRVSMRNPLTKEYLLSYKP